MKTEKISLDWLCNPEIFQMNREKAHSDHKYTIYGQQAKQSLNGTWKFTYANCPADRQAEFYQTDYDIEGLDNIQVPGHMQLQGYGIPQYVNVMYPWDGQQKAVAPEVPMDVNPVGGYVKDVVFDQVIMQGQRQFISFQGVENAFYLYVNDQFVGYSEDSFTPAEFDITEYIHEGTNRIGVEVYQRSSGSWLEDQDFFRFSGIFRDVYVYAIPEAHVRDLFVHTNVSDDYKDCELKIDAEVVYNLEDDDYKCDLILEDRDGKGVVSIKDIPLKQIFDNSYKIENAHLWSAEDPYLYTMHLTIEKGGKEIEKITQKIGMRRFEMKDKVMHINGKRIEFNGVNRHEFNCHTGRAITKEDMLWDIQFMKQHNINAVRTCHYPDNGLWYELCDEYGIYMIAEANLETHGTWTYFDKDPIETCIPGNKPEWCENVLDRANTMVQTYKNHSAILIWSCGNESFGGENIYKMSELMRQIDPSRLVHYEGIFHDRRYPGTSDMESQMYTRPWDIEEYLNNHPEKPFICCEYMHSMGNSCGGIQDYTDLLDKYQMYQGAFIWDYIDQALVKIDDNGNELLGYGGDFDEVPDDGNFCGDGIVTADRKPSTKVSEVKYVYQQVKMNVEFAGIRIRNKRLFMDTSDMILRLELLKDGTVVKQFEMEAVVEPLSEKYFAYDLSEELKESGEYIIQAAFVLKEDTLWAKAGFELMNGRSDAMEIESREEDKCEQTFSQAGVSVVRGNQNTGIHGKYFDIDMSRKNGGIISLQYKGKEILAQRPLPCYYRASTDNDRGCQYMFDSGVWEFAERRQRMVDYKVEESEEKVVIYYTYELPISEGGMLVVNDKREKTSVGENKGNGKSGILVNIIYTITSDGKIHITLKFHGAEGLPELPLFGMQFVLKKEFEQFSYYGIGPDENYLDRNNGGKYGIFNSTATENMAGYLKPQTCGNRTQTRWVELTDGDTKVKFAMSRDESPFQFTVLHYNESELETAMHREDLPNPNYTYVKIMPIHMGIGGDDSWGSQVRENCRFSSGTDITYSFDITLS